MTLPLLGCEQFNFPRQRWTWAYQGHVTPQDVEQLRQLVDAQAP
jgi:hypothetical protein